MNECSDPLRDPSLADLDFRVLGLKEDENAGHVLPVACLAADEGVVLGRPIIGLLGRRGLDLRWHCRTVPLLGGRNFGERGWMLACLACCCDDGFEI